MMEAAEPWHGDNFAVGACILRCHTASWSLLVEPKMRPVVMVVIDVLIHKALHMPLIERDHMIEQIPAAVAYPTLGDTVLPRTVEAGSLGLDAEAFYDFDRLRIET